MGGVPLRFKCKFLERVYQASVARPLLRAGQDSMAARETPIQLEHTEFQRNIHPTSSITSVAYAASWPVSSELCGMASATEQGAEIGAAEKLGDL